MTHADPLLCMRGVRKSFLGAPALVDASFEVGRGEVRALIGQNGAGKSTLIKVLTGVHRKDAGTITFDGRPVEFDSPHAAQAGGIATIYQEVNLVPYRTVTENIFLGRERRRFGLLDWRRMNGEARDLLAGLDIHVDVTRALRDYPIATQQMTAIARALSFDARLVIMDEPTSSLADHEVSVLFGVIRRLRADGVSVVFVSHRLDELYAVCDRVTIMRDGRTVDDRAMSDITRYELVSKMIGRDLAEVRREARRQRHGGADAAPVVAADGLRRGYALRGVDVEVRPGEIVGLAGLLGSGRSETARALFGADPPEAGEVRVAGEPVRVSGPRDMIRRGIGFCAEDRKAEGIIPRMSVRENITLALLPRLTRAGVVDRRRQREIVGRFVERLGIKAADAEQPVRELSGGNQQKVLLARWLCTDPRLLMLDEATRGIDVGAKQEILALIRDLADEGLGVLFISSELEELLENADRVVVLRDGRNAAELAGDQITEARIMTAMTQAGDAAADGPADGPADGAADDGRDGGGDDPGATATPAAPPDAVGHRDDRPGGAGSAGPGADAGPADPDPGGPDPGGAGGTGEAAGEGAR